MLGLVQFTGRIKTKLLYVLCFMKRYFYRFSQFDENINSLQPLNLLSANQNAKLYLFV
jgi:hypothetical protein